MDRKIIKVDNPTYMTQEEIREKYNSYNILVTNIQKGKGTWAGGVVRYYGTRAMHELHLLLNELDNGDTDYGRGGVFYMGDIPLNLYVSGGSQ